MVLTSWGEKIIKDMKKEGEEIQKRIDEKRKRLALKRAKENKDDLSKFPKDIKILNLSNKNIKGILDLSEFESLEELDCSNNKITEIINIPNTLKYLNCENNEITKLNNLPNNLTGINCKKNPLKEL
jgi:Leucine-rich repeat (LRR) protein